MINFATSWSATGTAASASPACWPAPCSRRCRFQPGDGGGDRLHPAAGHGQAGFPNKFGAGVITTSGALGILIPPSIVMVMYSVATNTSVGRTVHGRRHPRPRLAARAGGVTWYRAAQVPLSAPAQGHLGNAGMPFRQIVWGLLIVVVVMGGIYTGIFTPTEAAAMSAVYAFIVAVSSTGHGPEGRAQVLLNSANMSAMLLYIITNAVLFSFIDDQREHPAGPGRLDAGPRPGSHHLPADGERSAAPGRQLHGTLVHRADLRAHPLSGGGEAGHRPGAFRHP